MWRIFKKKIKLDEISLMRRELIDDINSLDLSRRDHAQTLRKHEATVEKLQESIISLSFVVVELKHELKKKANKTVAKKNTTRRNRK